MPHFVDLPVPIHFTSLTVAKIIQCQCQMNEWVWSIGRIILTGKNKRICIRIFWHYGQRKQTSPTSEKEPTRCDLVVEFIIPVFLNCSTCFGRNVTHHHELKNCNCSLWFYIRFGCLPLRWLSGNSAIAAAGNQKRV
jgi:hypothetical protein